MKLGNKKTCINKKIINKNLFLLIFSLFLALALPITVFAKITYINPAADTNLSINNTIFITTNNLVGIGNTNPNVTLHVSGAANITGYLEVGKGLNVSNGINVLTGNVGIGSVSPYNTLVVVGSVGVSGSLNASSINTTGGAYFATASGNVGIGTTSAPAKLYILNGTTGGSYSSQANADVVISSGGGSTDEAVLSFNGNIDDTNDRERASIRGIAHTGQAGPNNRGALAFNVNGGAETYEIMRLLQNGNVGINTTAPARTLTVQGTLNVSNPGTNGQLVMDSSGKVGIGTTGPGQKLHVIGNINSSDKIYANATYSNNQPSFYSFDDGLAWYIPFSEGNSTTDPTLYDRSKTGANAVCYGVPTGCNWTKGIVGNAVQFDGVDDLVNITTAGGVDLNNSLGVTYSLWVFSNTNPAANGNQRRLITDEGMVITQQWKGAGNAGSRILCNAGTEVSTFHRDETVDQSALPIQQWTHIACTYDGSDVRIYINGVQVSDQSNGNQGTGTIVDGNTEGTRIGGKSDEYFNGTIDEVRIYERALSDYEARQLYLDGLNATLKPYVGTTGNVGIGTTSPNYILQVASGTDGRSVNLSDVLYINASRRKMSIGGHIPPWSYGGDMSRNASIVTIVGNNDSGAATFLNLFNNDVPASGETGQTVDIDFHFADAADSGYLGARIRAVKEADWVGNADYDAGLSFWTQDQNAGFTNPVTERMRIDEAGNVGIGTTGPGTILTLHGSAPLLRIQSTTAGNAYIELGNYSGSTFDRQGFMGFGGLPDTLYISTDHTNGSIRLRTGASQERVIIDSSGNVGIGTTGPLFKLELKGTAASAFGDPQFALTGRALNKYTTIGFGHGSDIAGTTTQPTEIGYLETTETSYTKGDLVFATRDVTTDTAPSERMRITSAGDICDQGNDADLTDCSSDIRLKTNIQDYKYGLNEILQLKPVQFNWNSEAESIGYNPDLKVNGLIAQDVETIIPEWVSTNEKGYKKIPGYGDIPLALINAIQEQQIQIEKLKSDNDALKSRIALLEQTPR